MNVEVSDTIFFIPANICCSVICTPLHKCALLCTNINCSMRTGIPRNAFCSRRQCHATTVRVFTVAVFGVLHVFVVSVSGMSTIDKSSDSNDTWQAARKSSRCEPVPCRDWSALLQKFFAIDAGGAMKNHTQRLALHTTTQSDEGDNVFDVEIDFELGYRLAVVSALCLYCETLGAHASDPKSGIGPVLCAIRRSEFTFRQA